MDDKKKPKIRFQGFSDEWVEHSLGEIISYTKGFAFKSIDYKNDGTRIIRVSDLSLDGNTEKIYISSEKAKNYSNYEIVKDDIVITTVGSKAELRSSAVGKPVIFRENNGYLLNQNLVKLKLFDEFDSEFVFAQFQQESYYKHIVDIQRGNANQANITIENLLEHTNYYSTTEEQQKIGSLFSNIDNFINQKQKKYDKLVNIKKSMLEKMFPQNNSKYPEVRFEGFNDEWEEKELNEISDVRDGTHDSPKYILNGKPFITSKNVKDGYINYQDIQYISNEDFEEINKRSKVDVNDILMGMIGTIGNIALIREEPNFAIKNVALIKDVKKVDYLYLYTYLQTTSILKQLADGMDGGTQKFISLNKVRNLIIDVPTLTEQQKIGEYFQNLDNLINQQQKQLEKLKTIKKSLLENMFV